MAKTVGIRVVAPALAASLLLAACGTLPAAVRPTVRGATMTERPVLQVKSAFAEAPSEIVVAVDGPPELRPPQNVGKYIDSFSFRGTTYHLLDVGQKNLIQRALAALRDRGLRHADPNPMVYAISSTRQSGTPDDEFYALQYGLVQKDVPTVWRKSSGDPAVTVAVVDTGVDYSHPDLKDRVVLGPDLAFRAGRIFNRKDKDGPMDDNGHGTHCAGIIAATANNKLGIAGVAPDSRVMAVKVLSGKGGGTSYDVMKGVAHAITHGAKIVNMSLGGEATTSVERKFYDAAVQSGALIVAAAGNSADAVGFPAAYPGVLSVGATDSGGNLARFSNHDATMSVTAPGVGILSTMPGNTYAKMSGTSMAAPFVAGVAALVWSRHPDWNAQQVKEQIERTATDRGPAGVDAMYGHGEVNVLRAVAD
ncbi:MAG: S8 family serine peptidase [Candidatus Sericytochromatia bacterium]|nr:S8 family serine peptidase [Candidatus Sericytochromatia bacterium]